MNTFTPSKPFVDNPRFEQEREKILSDLKLEDVDEPIRDIVLRFNRFPFCFTLQCCYGHFVWKSGQDPHNFDPLPDHIPGKIRYRIAYIAFCLENSPAGEALGAVLSRVPDLDREYVQFGSADWFWERHLNSFALQVEPERFQNMDEAWVEWEEARRVERIRSLFFEKLRKLSGANSFVHP